MGRRHSGGLDGVHVPRTLSSAPANQQHGGAAEQGTRTRNAGDSGSGATAVFAAPEPSIAARVSQALARCLAFLLTDYAIAVGIELFQGAGTGLIADGLTLAFTDYTIAVGIELFQGAGAGLIAGGLTLAFADYAIAVCVELFQGAGTSLIAGGLKFRIIQLAVAVGVKSLQQVRLDLFTTRRLGSLRVNRDARQQQCSDNCMV